MKQRKLKEKKAAAPHMINTSDSLARFMIIDAKNRPPSPY
jgi:hypothetical protein